MVKQYDMAVIGTGPAGLHAAVQAAKLGKSVCIIEKNSDKIGGALVHTGTIPSKAMREALDAIQGVKKHLNPLWVQRLMHDLPMAQLVNRAAQVSQLEENLFRHHIHGNGIELVTGVAQIESEQRLRVSAPGLDSHFIDAKVIVIATGSRPRRPREIPFDGWRVIDSDDAMGMNSLPEQVLIYGAGIIGCEFACIFSSMGAQVTVIEARPEIMRQMDQDVVGELRRIMESNKVVFQLGESLDRIEVHGPKVHVHSSARCYEGDLLFFAGGRVSNTENLGLERVGIELNCKGAIVVNEQFQTKIPNIYAAGDVIGAPALAATSSHQGRAVACHAFGANVKEFPKVYPVGVYTIPELSAIGATEEELIIAGRPYVVGIAHYSEIARGHIRGESHGLIKMLVCKETHLILGLHIVGNDAANLIHIGQAFMMHRAHVQDFIDMIFNYPTLAEGYRIAAFNALNKLFPGGIIGAPPSSAKDDDVQGNTPHHKVA